MSRTYQTLLNEDPQKQTGIPWLSFLISLPVFIRGATFQRPFVNTIISAAQKNNSPSTMTDAVCLRLCGGKQATSRDLLVFFFFFCQEGFEKTSTVILDLFVLKAFDNLCDFWLTETNFRVVCSLRGERIMERQPMLNSAFTGSCTLQI